MHSIKLINLSYPAHPHNLGMKNFFPISNTSEKCGEIYKKIYSKSTADCHLEKFQKENITKMREIASNFDKAARKTAEENGTPTKDILYFSDLLQIYEKRSADIPKEVQNSSWEAVKIAGRFDSQVLKKAVKENFPLEKVLLAEEILSLSSMLELD